MKRPFFKFYAGDYRANANLRRCSWAARGAWIEVLCLMHDSDEYGVLRWPLSEIAHAIGAQISLLEELISKGVMKGVPKGGFGGGFGFTPMHAGKRGKSVVLIKDQEGEFWYSSRMVEDEHICRMKSDQEYKDKINTLKSPKGGIGEGIGEGIGVGFGATPKGVPHTQPKGVLRSHISDNVYIPNGIRQNPPDSNEELQRKNGKLSIPIKQIFELYKQKCPELTQHRILTKSMESSIKQRTIWLMKDKKFVENNDIIQWFDMFFSAVNTNDFLCGRTPIAEGSGRTKPFVADLQWLMKEDNFNKFLSGKYNNDK